MGTWFNQDNLYIKFGRDEAVSPTHPGGVYAGSVAGEHIVELVVNLPSLTETETILNDTVFVPNNAQVMWVETVALIGAATGTAIDVGMIKVTDRSTELDYDGFLAAFPLAEMEQVGETRRFYETHTVPASMTGTGALVGQEITTGPGYISASRTTATAFTAGKVKIRVAYVMRGLDQVGNS